MALVDVGLWLKCLARCSPGHDDDQRLWYSVNSRSSPSLVWASCMTCRWFLGRGVCPESFSSPPNCRCGDVDAYWQLQKSLGIMWLITSRLSLNVCAFGGMRLDLAVLGATGLHCLSSCVHPSCSAPPGCRHGGSLGPPDP